MDVVWDKPKGMLWIEGKSLVRLPSCSCTLLLAAPPCIFSVRAPAHIQNKRCVGAYR